MKLASRSGITRFCARADRFRLALLGALVAAATVGAVLTSAPWPARLGAHLFLFLAAGVLWAGAIALLPGTARRPRDLHVLVAVALLLRIPAWLSAPAHSDDVYRYAWDGRVSRAGINPYRYPPAADELAALRDGDGAPATSARIFEREAPEPTPGRAGLYARINNPDLPTIYPPLAQIVFFVAASLPLPPIAALKLCLGACDLAVLAMLLRALRRRGLDPRWAVVWGWSPLVAIELGQSAHLDALAILGLVGALDAWAAGERARAGLWFGLGVAAKLVALPLLLLFRSPRALAAGALACLVVALPFAGAGAAMSGSTGEFARRWRSNDGAYALIQAATDRAVCAALHAPLVAREGTPCERPVDLWPHARLAALISGRSFRAAIYPDEISSAAARLVAAGVVGLAMLWVLVRRMEPLAGAEWILGALLLFTPALKPWYITWLLPLAAFSRRPAWIALAAAAPLSYVPMGAWLGGGPWRDPVWTRLVEHGLCWALLLGSALPPALRWLRGPGRDRTTGASSTGAGADGSLYGPAEPATISPTKKEA